METLMTLATISENIDYTGLSGMIANLGFPIFVAIWLLWKSHKDTQVITDSVNELRDSITELVTYIKALKDK